MTNKGKKKTVLCGHHQTTKIKYISFHVTYCTLNKSSSKRTIKYLFTDDLPTVYEGLSLLHCYLEL